MFRALMFRVATLSIEDCWKFLFILPVLLFFNNGCIAFLFCPCLLHIYIYTSPDFQRFDIVYVVR